MNLKKLITYPNDNNESDLYNDQTSLRKFIKEFNDSLIEAGLIRLKIDGQLDVNNIEDPILTNDEYFFKPLIYMFTPDDIDPIYIKFIFKLTKTTFGTPVNRTLKTTIQICMNQNFTDKTFNYVDQIITISSGSSSAATLINTNSKTNSIINVNNEKGFLHLSICPYTRCKRNFADSTYGLPVIFLIINKVSSKTYQIHFSWISSNPSMPPNSIFYNSGNEIYGGTSNEYPNFKQSVSSYVNGAAVAQPLLAQLNSNGTEIDITTNILFGNANIFGNRSFLSFNAVLDDTTIPIKKQKYLTICSDNGFLINNDSSNCLLILDE